MATQSFLKEFAVNKKNEKAVAQALQNEKRTSLKINTNVRVISKDQVKKIFQKERNE